MINPTKGQIRDQIDIWNKIWSQILLPQMFPKAQQVEERLSIHVNNELKRPINFQAHAITNSTQITIRD